MNICKSGARFLILFAWLGSFANARTEDPLFGFILLEKNVEAIREINKRLEILPDGSEKKNKLLLQKTSLLLKSGDPIAAKATLAQITLAARETSEYIYKSWLVYSAMLEITSVSHSRYVEYVRQSSADLERVLANPALYNPSLVAGARRFLGKYPNKKLSEQLAQLARERDRRKIVARSKVRSFRNGNP